MPVCMGMQPGSPPLSRRWSTPGVSLSRQGQSGQSPGSWALRVPADVATVPHPSSACAPPVMPNGQRPQLPHWYRCFARFNGPQHSFSVHIRAMSALSTTGSESRPVSPRPLTDVQPSSLVIGMDGIPAGAPCVADATMLPLRGRLRPVLRRCAGSLTLRMPACLLPQHEITHTCGGTRRA